MTRPRLILGTALIVIAGIPQEPAAVFRSNVRLVEVYATVYNRHGRFVDGLKRHDFQVRDNGVAQEVIRFETNETSLSCAILLDTTGSMSDVLPVVKKAVVSLIDELRPTDTVAVYSFNQALHALQDFTSDHSAAKRAVFRTRASGQTALFDALSILARDLMARNGKKMIVAFTDGDDNASVLNARAAMQRAKKTGVPVYAIAQGKALTSRSLLQQLEELSEITGGNVYRVRSAEDIRKVFASIGENLQHTYLISYKPPTDLPGSWRKIEISVASVQGARIRAKEGYFAE